MAPDERTIEEIARLSPEEQTEWARQHIADWSAFEQSILKSRAELQTWRQAGNTGVPPGWVAFRDYLRERDL